MNEDNMHEDTGAIIDKLQDEDKDSKAEEEYNLEQAREKHFEEKVEEMIIWRGYEFITSNGKKIYSVSLTLEKAERLFEGLKEWTGSQKDFYFEYVNPLKLCEDYALKPLRGKRY